MSKNSETLLALAELLQSVVEEAEKTLDFEEVDAYYEAFVTNVDTSDIDYLGLHSGRTVMQMIGEE